MKPPCYNCPDRAITFDENGKAHSCREGCDRYKRFRSEKDRALDKKHETYIGIEATCDSVSRTIRKQQRHLRR